MKVLKKNNGFTLIETLVSINISFIAISLIISFYLFTQKFSESLSKNYTNKYIEISFFNNLERALRKSDEYFINILDDKIIIKTSNDDSIYIAQDSISLNSLFSISNIENLDISISTDIDNKILIKNCEIISDLTSLLVSKNSIKSNLINSIFFEIKNKKGSFSFKIYNLNISANHFKNIKKNSVLENLSLQ